MPGKVGATEEFAGAGCAPLLLRGSICREAPLTEGEGAAG
jgi:hypothetical protein